MKESPSHRLGLFCYQPKSLTALVRLEATGEGAYGVFGHEPTNNGAAIGVVSQ